MSQNSPMRHKHETLLKCPHTTSPQANWRHPRHRLLECAWKIFDIGAIVIPSFEHILIVHYIFSFDI